MLDDRAAARSAYEDAVGRAGTWELSPLIRRAMDAWQFDAARRLVGQANAALDEWTRVGEAAAAIGLAPSDAARLAFEGSGGPAAAAGEMDAELAALGVIRDATATRAAVESSSAGLLAGVGLAGESPDALLADARSAYETGDLATSSADAAAARATWEGAEEQGKRRLTVALFVAVGGGGVLVLAVGRLRRRRALPEARGSYATLGADDEKDSSGEGRETPR